MPSFLLAYQTHSEKGSILEGKDLLPTVSNTFLLDSFSKGTQNNLNRVACFEFVSFPLNMPTYDYCTTENTVLFRHYFNGFLLVNILH